MESYLHDTFAAMHAISWMVYVAFAFAIGSDVCIAGSLCYFFYTNRTGVRRTDSVLNVLMLYCINGGILTTLCNISVFVTFATLPTNYVFMAIFFVSSKLYFSSFAATLNCRDMLRTNLNASESVTLPMARVPRSASDKMSLKSFTFSPASKSRSQTPGLPLRISVSVDTHMDGKDGGL